MAMLMAACSSFPSASGRLASTDPTLASIDSLLWTHPDSAFVQLQAFAESHEVDSLDTFNGHYFHLLLSELLYKNDYAQTNRSELLHAVSYYDSLVEAGGNRVHSDLAFLDARAHYIDGVGYYEMDSAVPACEQYLIAIEVMENRFGEEELVGKKAQFMALGYTRLMTLFSNYYLHEQAIFFGKSSLSYYGRYDATSWHVSWILEEIGSNYDMLEQLDSASYYYDRAASTLNDATGLMFRDITAHKAYLSFKQGGSIQIAVSQFRQLLLFSEDETEYASRCLSLGELFYDEKEYDSAKQYMFEVFRGTCCSTLKWLAAKRLLEMDSLSENRETMNECLGVIAQNSFPRDQQGKTMSILTEYHKVFFQQKENNAHNQRVGRIKRMIVLTVGLLLCILLVFGIVNGQSLKRERSMEAQLEEERYVFKMQQAALSGKLKRQDAVLKTMKKRAGKKECPIQSVHFQPETAARQYMDEPICQHILKACNDKLKPIKSVVSNKEYKNIELSSVQLAQLNDAAMKHYGPLWELIEKEYPKLKARDLVYCQLCLIGLNNVQIAALLQKAPSTIFSQKKRLQRIFDQNSEISVILMSLLKH